MKAYKKFWFEASHTLPDNPQMHGHSYLATLWFETSKDKPVDVKQIDKLEWQLKRYVDHRHLNEIISNPTMESIAVSLFNYGLSLSKSQDIKVEFISVDVERPSLNFGVVT